MAADSSPQYESKLNIAYSDASVLNTVDVYLPKNENARSVAERYWIVFVHGGGWRDPRNTSRDIVPALQFLSPEDHSIAGIASLNYRLSEHDQFPSDPDTPDRKARSATHPTHIEDVLAAIAWLQDRYKFGGKYLLAGHSVGSTLALQSVMGVWKPGGVDGRSFVLPSAVVGFCGVYDLPLLLKTHSDVPTYKRFLEAAFGTDQAQWKAASPVTGKFRDTWPDGKVAIIVHSIDDERIDFVQAETMSDSLWREKKEGRRDVVVSITGKHDGVWEQGEEIAKALKRCLGMLG